jgi:DNA-binding MarR family transcriptional regulator
VNTKTDREEQLTLEVLDAVDKRSDLSQRHLARQMGVALGLTNSYLRRCIRKGWVKINEAPANRYFYYLTPKGLAEKSRLTGKYLASSFAFYRRAGQSCQAVFDTCADKGWRRVLLCGMSDLAEIAILRASETEIDVIGVCDASAGPRRFIGKPVWPAPNQADGHDVCMLTDLQAPLATYQQLAKLLGGERVLVPDILGIVPPRAS